MNQLISENNGGFPVTLNDLRFIEGAVRTAFEGLLKAFQISNDSTFIVYGCERAVSGGIVTIAEGAVSINGELCIVQEHSYPVPGPGFFEFFDLDISSIPEGLKVLQNGVSVDAYTVRNAKVKVAGSIPSGLMAYSSIQNMFSIIQTKIPQIGLNTTAIAGKAPTVHYHSELKYLTSVKLQTISQGVRVLGELRANAGITTYGGELGVFSSESSLSRGYITRNEQDDFLGIRVDFDGSPNWNALFEFKTNGDLQFSNINNRIRDRNTGTIIGSTSDKRFKKEIEPLGAVLDQLMALKPVTHQWISDEEGDRVFGLIAQEVQGIFPEIVDTSREGYLSLDYPKLTVILIKAIQEQQRQIESLAKSIEQ